MLGITVIVAVGILQDTGQEIIADICRQREINEFLKETLYLTC